MNLIFRDHAHFRPDRIRLFRACRRRKPRAHLMRNIKESAQPVLDTGAMQLLPSFSMAKMPGNTIPQSGREFLRRFYDALQNDRSNRGGHGFRSD